MQDTFRDVNSSGKKLISDILFEILGAENKMIYIRKLATKFKVTPEIMADLVLRTFGVMDVISGPLPSYDGDDDPPFLVTPQVITDINPELLALMTGCGYTIEKIKKQIGELPREKKKPVSTILTRNEGRVWIEVEAWMPETNKDVVIRFVDETKVFSESATEVIYAEDLKIGSWNGERWVITGPHPKYDMSPISNQDKLHETAHVTHWSEATETELVDWANRFRPIIDFEYLNLKVDDKHEKDVYMALITAASFISRFGGDDYIRAEPHTNLRKVHEILCDLMTSIDRGGPLTNDGSAKKEEDNSAVDQNSGGQG